MADLTAQEQLLMKEFEVASKLTFHIDKLRNQVTSFVLTFSGVAVTGLVFLFRENTQVIPFANPMTIIAIALLLIASIGVTSVAILARLRKSQIEHFRIMNNIRTYFLKSNYELWNVVQLSTRTLPSPNHKSGTYFWLIAVMLFNSSAISAVLFIVMSQIPIASTNWGYIIFLVFLLLAMLVQDRLYFSLAAPPQVKSYDANNPPA